ncbi:hypothetical protein EDD86DRAFT_99402 [Gorgonomyces haynaldii]|nr:hypothetical protein EDD86DRAFT_99402 [Gorgonomyces haynaldii]
MFARVSKRLLRGESSVGPYGPMQFPGANWKGAGAVPFRVNNRIFFHIGFWTFSIIGLGLPFLNAELRCMPLRIKKWEDEKKQ